MAILQYQIVISSARPEGLTLDDVALRTGIHPRVIEELVEFGLLSPARDEEIVTFDPSTISRLRTIVRLRRSLGINLSGVSVILDLLDKLCALERENSNLRRRS